MNQRIIGNTRRKGTNKGQQNMTQKTKDWATQTSPTLMLRKEKHPLLH
jgi:hypothetical protein